MSTFGDYARYYNLLYRDKDYAGEAAFVLDVLRRHGCEPGQILDLGCGTGKHALELAKREIQVTGVDMSETMLAIGRESIAEQTWESAVVPDLHLGDARTVRLGRKFDAVISLFHVMSYQNTETDALAVMKTAKEHLKPGGQFLFDFWYGPGVLTDPPERRERILQDDSTHLQRIAEPIHHVNDNIVEVHYTVTLQDKSSGNVSQLKECHSMRYWFLPELRFHSEQTGMKILQEGACLALDLPDSKSWSAWMLLRDLSI